MLHLNDVATLILLAGAERTLRAFGLGGAVDDSFDGQRSRVRRWRHSCHCASAWRFLYNYGVWWSLKAPDLSQEIVMVVS